MKNRTRTAPMIVGVCILFMAPLGQAQKSSGESANSLFGKRWRLTEVSGVPTNSTKPYIEFDETTQRFSGYGGCNRISGNFQLNRSSIKFTQPISTMRACLDTELQIVEGRFFRNLTQVDRFHVEDDVLGLYSRERPSLTFKAEPTGTSEAHVRGTIKYLQRIALPRDAIVKVTLADVSRADAPAVTIAEQTIKPAGRQVPFVFDLRYDPNRINQTGRYVIQARITNAGKLIFINTDSYPVITGGNPSSVEVIVRPVRK